MLVRSLHTPLHPGISAVSDQLLSKLQQIGEKMELMDRRVQCTEAALEQGNSRVSPLPSMSQSQPGSSTVSSSNATETNAECGPLN